MGELRPPAAGLGSGPRRGRDEITWCTPRPSAAPARRDRRWPGSARREPVRSRRAGSAPQGVTRDRVLCSCRRGRVWPAPPRGSHPLSLRRCGVARSPARARMSPRRQGSPPPGRGGRYQGGRRRPATLHAGERRHQGWCGREARGRWGRPPPRVMSPGDAGSGTGPIGARPAGRRPRGTAPRQLLRVGDAHRIAAGSRAAPRPCGLSAPRRGIRRESPAAVPAAGSRSPPAGERNDTIRHTPTLHARHTDRARRTGRGRGR
jgi:hypothetical protein